LLAEPVEARPVEAKPVEAEPERELFEGLALGIRDFAAKNGLSRAFLGLSGGIDSAVTAILAAQAIGPENVIGVAIPSRYSDPRSTDCARELADNLGIGFEVVELERLHQAAETTLAPWLNEGTTAENIQARLRALILMALVNSRGGFLLNTSNKTELALGYSTLYGDMAGSLCPIADLTKPDVYRLARWIQAERGVIPDFIMERPPSAELRPDQVDPFDYDVVAPALEELILQNQSNTPLRRSEHKRWHMGVILKVSEKAFGSGRLIPITRR
jgi:NAD+ synthase (glutamine-hydrolysing)